jgi:hypothetical protein
MSETNDPRVDDLIARQEVIEAIDDLFVATDRKAWDAVRAVLAPTVRFDMSSAGGGPVAELTGDQIADGWAQGLEPIEQIHHQAGNYRVRANGDRAEAFCYAVAWHYRRVPSGRNTRVFVGSYDYELRRMDAADRPFGGFARPRWRITAFRYTLKFIDGNLELDKES